MKVEKWFLIFLKVEYFEYRLLKAQGVLQTLRYI